MEPKQEKRKSIAPQELGELPNEKRCKQCWALLSQIEQPNGRIDIWCSRCKVVYGSL